MSWPQALMGDVVEITWDDAYWWNEDSEEGEWDDEFLTTTYGQIVKLTEKSVFVAAEVQGNGKYKGVSRIPYVYITQLKVLEHGGSTDGTTTDSTVQPGTGLESLADL